MHSGKNRPYDPPSKGSLRKATRLASAKLRRESTIYKSTLESDPITCIELRNML